MAGDKPCLRSERMELERIILNIFLEEGYLVPRIEKRLPKAWDIILFYETSHPSWVCLRWLNYLVDVHFSYAIRTPHIPEQQLREMFNIPKTERVYSGYVYIWLKSPILAWANVWDDEIHLHHRAFPKDYELISHLRRATKEMKRLTKLLKENPKKHLENRPRLYGQTAKFEPVKAIAYVHSTVAYPEWRERIIAHVNEYNRLSHEEFKTAKPT